MVHSTRPVAAEEHPPIARSARGAAQTRASKKTVATRAASKKTPPPTSRATLTLSSRNYSSWSLRGWLLARFAGLEFDEVIVPPDDAAARRELLLLAPSIRVPCLTHDGAKSWNVMAIAYYLDEIRPDAGLMPVDRAARAHCRSICGEMNSGFANLRSSLPMNLKARHPGFKIWAGARPDIERVFEIWRECLSAYGGRFLFGDRPTMADAMFAPVVTRFVTYDVALDKLCAAYAESVMALPEMRQWIAAAKREPEEIEELDMEF
jgi:glutathione S-transferase